MAPLNVPLAGWKPFRASNLFFAESSIDSQKTFDFCNRIRHKMHDSTSPPHLCGVAKEKNVCCQGKNQANHSLKPEHRRIVRRKKDTQPDGGRLRDAGPELTSGAECAVKLRGRDGYGA